MELSEHEKKASEQFSEKKTVYHFPEKKNKKIIPWTKIKYGKFQAKMQISEHYGSKYEQWFKLKDILGGSSTGSKVRAEFCLHHGSDVQTTVHWFSQNEQIFLKFGILYLCSTAFLGSLVKSCKGRGWWFCLFLCFSTAFYICSYTLKKSLSKYFLSYQILKMSLPSNFLSVLLIWLRTCMNPLIIGRNWHWENC